MGKQRSEETKEEVLQRLKSGEQVSKIAADMDIPPTTIHTWRNKWIEEGKLAGDIQAILRESTELRKTVDEQATTIKYLIKTIYESM